MLQKKRTRSKSNSAFKECHKMKFSGIRTGWPESIIVWQAASWIPDRIDHFRFGQYRKIQRVQRSLNAYNQGTWNFWAVRDARNFKTVQCTTCLRFSFEGAYCCTCGVCLMPSPEQTRKMRNRFEICKDITSGPFFAVWTPQGIRVQVKIE